MIDLTDKSQLIQYLKSNGLYAKHSLGQNFLVDREVLEKIVETAEITPPPTPPRRGGELIIEVGPGVGTLTAELVKVAGKVIAVEMDDRLAELLKSELEYRSSNIELRTQTPDSGLRISDLEVINADILKLNISELTKDHPTYKVVANIPYYITSKILEFFLTQKNKPESITLLVQKEVAERICARPGQLSVLAISVQAYAEPEIIQVVKASSFFPSPKVDSAIIKIKNIYSFCHSRAGGNPGRTNNTNSWIPGSDRCLPEDDKYCGEKDFFRLVHIGFASKRKTLVNNLATGYHIDKIKASAIIKSVGLGENVRAQELSIEEWVRLVKSLSVTKPVSKIGHV